MLFLCNHYLKENWFLGALSAGMISTVINVILPLFLQKGMVPMSILILVLTLGACGRVGVMVAQFQIRNQG